MLEQPAVQLRLLHNFGQCDARSWLMASEVRAKNQESSWRLVGFLSSHPGDQKWATLEEAPICISGIRVDSNNRFCHRGTYDTSDPHKRRQGAFKVQRHECVFTGSELLSKKRWCAVSQSTPYRWSHAGGVPEKPCGSKEMVDLAN